LAVARPKQIVVLSVALFVVVFLLSLSLMSARGS
jgi:hypothetical protein